MASVNGCSNFQPLFWPKSFQGDIKWVISLPMNNKNVSSYSFFQLPLWAKIFYRRNNQALFRPKSFEGDIKYVISLPMNNKNPSCMEFLSPFYYTYFLFEIYTVLKEDKIENSFIQLPIWAKIFYSAITWLLRFV